MGFELYVQMAAVRTMRRAQWFLMSLPIAVERWGEVPSTVGTEERKSVKFDCTAIAMISA